MSYCKKYSVMEKASHNLLPNALPEKDAHLSLYRLVPCVLISKTNGLFLLNFVQPLLHHLNAMSNTTAIPI